MMDGRFDQHFAELFATSASDEAGRDERPSLWPLAVACICGLIALALAAAQA